MCIGTSVVEEVQDVVPMVDQGSRPICGEKVGCVTFKNKNVRV
jgi:hypothetical protein